LKAGTELEVIKILPGTALLSLDGRQGWFYKDEYRLGEQGSVRVKEIQEKSLFD